MTKSRSDATLGYQLVSFKRWTLSLLVQACNLANQDTGAARFHEVQPSQEYIGDTGQLDCAVIAFAKNKEQMDGMERVQTFGTVTQN